MVVVTVVAVALGVVVARAVIVTALLVAMRLMRVLRVVVVLRALVRVRPAGVIVVLLAMPMIHGARVSIMKMRVAVFGLLGFHLCFRSLRFFERGHGLLLGHGLAVLLEHVRGGAGEHDCWLCGARCVR